MTSTLQKANRGVPTKHRIRFRSERWIVAGGIQNEDAKKVQEFEGFLFNSYHTTTHLCVGVDKQADWYRDEAWHGFVAKQNVIEVQFLNDQGDDVTQAELAELINEDFRTAWGDVCHTLD
ncbi:hypothetical protein NHH03_25850 [Stieleria sp. TO1_6]|uniref:hypothetical protein n=1 Tax=Stieleria tagensis TaxID=2956795 RepID=UPI00209AFCEE|nr:hypothetical protein [Stieleria tagensis]MCO8125187.1 hypothetical protein [Stieleria tagensis]